MTFVPFHWNEQVEPVHFGATTFLLTLRPGELADLASVVESHLLRTSSFGEGN